MSKSISQARPARQRALAGYDSAPAPQSVGDYKPAPTYRAGMLKSWSGQGERVDLLECRRIGGREVEVLVTDDTGTRQIDVVADETAAEVSAKKYMRSRSN